MTPHELSTNKYHIRFLFEARTPMSTMRAHWEFLCVIGGWQQQDPELRIKLRACQGDDTMTVSRHRYVVTHPICDIRKSYFLANLFIVSR
jgi:hypothetical protein